MNNKQNYVFTYVRSMNASVSVWEIQAPDMVRALRTFRAKYPDAELHSVDHMSPDGESLGGISCQNSQP